MKNKSNPYLTLITIVFGVLFVNFFLKNEWLTRICLGISALGVFSFKGSLILEKIWFKISFILSQIIPNILLSLIFFLVLTPIAFISKLFKAKSDFKTKNDQESVYVSTNKSFGKESFERAW